jgi:nucleotide-binding universal stress UspA family protein
MEEDEWMANFGGSAGSFVATDAEARRAAASAQLSGLLARYGLRGEVRVGDAPAAQLITDAARELRADLITVGAPRSHRLRHLLRRSIADRIVAAAAASVLVVPYAAHLAAPE